MPNHDYVASTMCPERLRLSEIVTKAVQANYAAKEEQDRAVKNKKDTASFALALARARRTESVAVAALNKHRKEHGC